jgi:diguanylate cyclase
MTETKQLNAKMELLGKVALFSTLKESGLEVVARSSGLYSFKKGDVIFREGSYGEGLYVVSEGEVLITRQTADNETMNIAQFIHGESFGEMDLLEGRVMPATAVAETDAVILIFPERGTRFQDVLSVHPELSAQILHELLATIAGRIRSTNRLISEKSQWVGDLKRQLYYDKLTGLYNRTFLNEELPARMAEYGPTAAIVMVKPDNFKAINDTYGHEAGDRALKLMAYSLSSQLREQDVAVRYRGDEFAVIFPGTGAHAAREYAERMLLLLRGLDFSPITGGTEIRITGSAGIVVYPDDARDAKELVELSFKRMFTARDSGGDRVTGGEQTV